MDIEQLIKRLKAAYVGASLRQLARECDVSHELLRKLISVRKTVANITAEKYNKIDAGLRKNGF